MANIAKKVNGKIVRIPIDLFEKAAEGMLLSKLAASNIKDKVPVDCDWANKFIEIYNAFFVAMPFPMYAVENNVKYAAAGELILAVMGDKAPEMWVDMALFADVGDGKALKLAFNSWAVVEKTLEDEEKGLRIDDYIGELGYEEFRWVLGRLMRKQGVEDFYKQFMPEFVRACNEDPAIIRWELSNILTYGYVPDRTELPINRIRNLDTNEDLIMDIYRSGEKVYETNSIVRITGVVEEIQRKTPVYDFSLMSKSLADDKMTKLKEEKSKFNGAIALFLKLVAIRKATKSKEFPEFQAVIAEGKMIFFIEKRMFICKAYRESEAVEVAVDVEMYSYKNGKVYFTKKYTLGNGIRKVQIISIGLNDGAKRLCQSFHEVIE